MEEQLGLLDLVLNASFTVQFVMAILMLASMFSWYMIVNRFIYFRNARDEMYRFEERFWSGIDLSQLYREGNEKAAEGHPMLGMESIFRAGFKEFVVFTTSATTGILAMLPTASVAVSTLSRSGVLPSL